MGSDGYLSLLVNWTLTPFQPTFRCFSCHSVVHLRLSNGKLSLTERHPFVKRVLQDQRNSLKNRLMNPELDRDMEHSGENDEQSRTRNGTGRIT